MATPTQPNAFDLSSNMMSGAGDIYKQMGEGAGSLTNINSYMSPYLDSVLNSALGRMDTNYQTQLGQIGDAALASGAFGGSRHGVAEGIAAGEYNKNVGELTAGVQQQGFESAAERLYRDMMSSAQGQGSLGGAYYNVGKDIMGTQEQQGATQQQLLQSILDQGSSDFNAMMQNPYQMITLMQALLSGDPRNNNVTTTGTGTQSTTPSFFDYLSAAAGMAQIGVNVG